MREVVIATVLAAGLGELRLVGESPRARGSTRSRAVEEPARQEWQDV